MQKEHHGFLFGILAAFTSAFVAIFIKLTASIPTETLVFARFVIPLPLILWLMRRHGIQMSYKKVPGHLVRSLAGLISMYSYFYAVKALPLVNAMTLSNTSPLFIPFIVLIWLKLVVSKLRFLALGIGFLGVVILLRPDQFVFNWGILAGLATGLFSAIAYVSIRQLSKTEPTETILGYYFVICSVITFFPMIFVWQPIPQLDWIYLLGLGAVSFLYQYALTRTFTLTAATKAGSLNYLAVVFGGLAGWWLFNEVPDFWVLVGAILIIAGALLALFDKTPPHPLNLSN